MALSASDVQTVYSLLSNSLCPDESLRKPAEAALAQCENRPGFCSCLLVTSHRLSVFLDFLFFVSFSVLGSAFIFITKDAYWRLIDGMVDAGDNRSEGFGLPGGCPASGFGVFQEQHQPLLEA